MIDSTRAGGAALPDDPPNLILKRARGRAKALARSIYVYHSRSEWVMTADLNEPPWDAAVWMVAANQNDPACQMGRLLIADLCAFHRNMSGA